MRTFFLCAGILFSVLSSAQQVAKGLTASNGVFIGFEQYTPTDYAANPNTKYPLIIFLHGIGERGNGTTDLANINANAIPKYLSQGNKMTFTWNGKTETFLVLSPQLSASYGYWQNFYVDEMIKYAKQNLRIDTNRIILTGLSLGGGGVWSYSGASLANAKQFAAIGVSCGTCQSQNWCNIGQANLPTWAFHANDDGTVAVGCATGAISSILACNPAVKPYMTIWPNGNHFIWDRVFDTAYNWQNPNIYEWFLAQNKSLPVNVRPLAKGGPDLTATTTGGIVSLDGSASSDPDGSIIRLIWRNISGPATVNITTPVSANGKTTATGLSVAGTYQFELKAVDNRADWSLDTVNVVVGTGGPNLPPVVNAGPDVTLTLPANSTSLNGSSSYDREGYINSWQWSKVSGPTQYTIASPAASITSISNLVQGVYVFTLTAWDNQWVPAVDTVVVTVNGTSTPPPASPVANAGGNVALTLPTNSTMLNGSNSSDAGGSIVAYSWTKVSGPAQATIANPNSATTSLTNLVQGTYGIRLQVTDNNNSTAADTITVTVNATSSQTTVVNAGADIAITLPANSTTLNGSASSDPNGGIKQYLWSYISGPSQYTIASASAISTTLSNLVQGTYSFKLTIWDHNWVPIADTIKVIVNGSGSNPPPPSRTPNAGADITITLPTNNTTLDGSASSDPNGGIRQYKWNFASGPSQYTIATPSAATTALSNLVQGTYSFILTVWDHNWTPSNDTVLVIVNGTVSNPPPPPPANRPAVAVAGTDTTILLPSNSTLLNGSASYDLDGALKAYHWLEISGPTQYTIANSTAATTAVTNLVPGTYTFQLTVWGDNWVPVSDTVNITVSSTVTSARIITFSKTNVSNEQVQVIESIKIFPNPAKDMITLQCSSINTGNTTISVFDITGRLAKKIVVEKGQALYQQAIDISDLRPGIYEATIIIGNKKQMISKFIKQ